MTVFSRSLRQRQNHPVPTRSPIQSLNQTLNQSEAIVEVLIDGLSGVGTINLTVTGNLGPGSQTGAFVVNQTSTMAPLAGGLPLTQVSPVDNSSVISATTTNMPTGAFGANQTSADGLPSTQALPADNGSVISSMTAYAPTGFNTSTIPSLPTITGTATALTNFTGAPGSAAPDGPDGSISLLLVLFRAVFGGA
jgi:hypothetical protein